jgi:beta propeller domain-containing protein
VCRRSQLALVVPVLATIIAQGASPAAAAPRSAAGLARFDSCADLTSYARSAVRRTGGSLGVPTRVGSVSSQPLGRRPATGDPQFADGVPAPVASAPAAAGPQEAAGETTTNVQEAGVDEPDLVKSDGRRLFALANGSLHAIEVNHDTPVLAGSLTLAGSPAELLVRGDRVLVIGSAATATPQPGPPGVVADAAVPEDAGGQQVQLTEVDVSDPMRMRVARTLTVAGVYVSARLTGATARVVLSSPPDLPQDEPVSAPAATARAAVVPRSTLRSRLSGRTFRRALVRCRAVRHPVSFSGLDLLTILTIDLDQGLFDVDRDAVMAGAQTVYASERSLYVASQRWVPGVAANPELAGRLDTEIHRFDASRPGATAYASSGSVSGSVLNQFSLSEHDGALRVASTDTPPWVEATARPLESESAVTVLREREGRLEAAGRVGGLGRGERIYAVRFVGDRGYVVTFRQVDPLYVVDLADPTAPRVAGELKIPGYSAYLHPVGDDLLLGIGQDATEQGRRIGLQASLFDVSNPSRPSRLEAHALGNGGSEVEYDHHAFLWWAPEQLAVLPIQQYVAGGEGTGAVGLRVTRATGIGERGRVEHPGPFPIPVRRSLVAGERLVTISDRGVATSRLATLAPLGFLAFPAAP